MFDEIGLSAGREARCGAAQPPAEDVLDYCTKRLDQCCDLQGLISTIFPPE
jgi:hypothetical protein